MVISLNTQKEPEKITSTKELAEYIRKSVMEDNELSDEEKAKKDAEILNKLKFGKKLTPNPAREYMVAAIDRVSSEMHKSLGYSRLPNTEADVQKAKDKKSNILFNETEDDEDDDDSFDLDNWSPLQEVMDEMPKFEVGA